MNKTEMFNKVSAVRIAHVIQAKFLNHTNTKGARVKLTSKIRNQSVYIGFHSSDFSHTSDIAIEYLITKGFNIICFDKYDDVYYIMVEEHTKDIK